MVAQDDTAAPIPVTDAEAAEAAAEVAAMTGMDESRRGATETRSRRRRRSTGTRSDSRRSTSWAQPAEGVGGFEILDETGERVRARFLQFLLE